MTYGHLTLQVDLLRLEVCRCIEQYSIQSRPSIDPLWFQVHFIYIYILFFIGNYIGPKEGVRRDLNLSIQNLAHGPTVRSLMLLAAFFALPFD